MTINATERNAVTSHVRWLLAHMLTNPLPAVVVRAGSGFVVHSCALITSCTLNAYFHCVVFTGLRHTRTEDHFHLTSRRSAVETVSVVENTFLFTKKRSACVCAHVFQYAVHCVNCVSLDVTHGFCTCAFSKAPPLIAIVKT